jgi:membrane-bound lytic murein transglycosylase B
MTDATVDLLHSGAFEGRKFTLNDTVATLRAQGVQFDTSQGPDAAAFMVAVDQPDGVNWRVGFKNFYVITRYNRSALYAMAATELAAALKQHLATEQLPVPNLISGAQVFEVLPP